MFFNFLILDSITATVDGIDYATIVPPDEGFAGEAANLQSAAGEMWKDGSPLAPFDKEVRTLGHVFVTY